MTLTVLSVSNKQHGVWFVCSGSAVPVAMSCYTVKLLYACFLIDPVHSRVPCRHDFCCNCSGQLPFMLNFFLQVSYGVTNTSSDELSSGYFPGVWVLKADVSEHCVGSIFNRWWSVSEDWLVFSPYLYGKRISWKVVWANQKCFFNPLAYYFL